jgi:hypothetical protein
MEHKSLGVREERERLVLHFWNSRIGKGEGVRGGRRG